MPASFRRKVTIAVTAAAVAFATPVFAQNQNESPQKAPPRRALGLGADARLSPGFEGVLLSVLTEEQRASLREAMAGEREKIRELEQKIREARKELFELGLREKFDADAVQQKAEAAAKLDAEMTVLRVKAISQIRPRLSAEQIQKIKDSVRARAGEGQSEPPRRRHDIPRDENGLPLKEQPAPTKTGAQEK